MANASMRAGRVSEASIWLDRAAAAQPDDSKARTRLAMDRLGMGQVDAAVKDLDAAIALDPGATDARIMRVLTFLQQRKLDDAAAGAEALKKDLPGNPIPDNLLGGVNMARGNLAAARSNFNAALAAKSDFLPAMFNLAKLNIAEGKLEDAVASYEAALQKSPSNNEALLALADLARQRNKPDDVAAWLNRAKAANPDNVQARLGLVNFYLAQKKNDEALAEAKDFFAKVPGNPSAMDALGRAQIAAGDKTGALDTYRSLVAAAPRSPQPYERLAQVQLFNGDTEGALSTLRSGSIANPDTPGLVSALSELLRQSGQETEGLRALRDWQVRHPKLAVGSLMIGNYLSQQGKFKEAADAYSTAHRDEPSAATIVPLAMAKLSAKDGDGAIATLSDWLKANPDDSTARFALTSAQIKLGRNEAAIAQTEALLKEKPNNPALLNNLAWLYGLKDRAKGIEVAEKAFALAPNSPEVADTLGYLLIQNGQASRGVTLLEKAYEETKQPEIGFHLATGLKQLNRVAEARTILEAATITSADYPSKEEAKALLASLAK
jgi:putative PEP-CTERM system TPR-repeat lipoprotein